MRIFLADLGHNELTISSDVYPLGIANLSSYLKAYLKTRESFQIHLFKEPQDLKASLDQSLPDILALSGYSWNHDLSLTFARYAKNRSKKVLTLMGGPNFPLSSVEQEKFLRGIPEIDIAVRGPTYEGERAFLNIIRRYLEVDGSLQGLQEEAVPGNLWIHKGTGEFVQGPDVERIQDLDEIPSPYLGGWMDQFFGTGYLPLMQISRGCPFSCSFCNSSVKSNSRIFSHSLENVKKDLLYIAQRLRPEIALSFADDNFGMYPLDEEVADYIAYLQDRFGWPRYIRGTTGKNQGERIIRVMRRIRGVLPMTSAVQSMSPLVLKKIERSNIRLRTYAEIQEELKAQRMQSYGELILGLPGETRASFMKGVRDLLEAGVKRISAHQLILLHGAPMSNAENRKQFGFETRFRVIARNIGDYTGEPVIETEEMVVATPTFSFEDYLDVRVFHLLLTIFYYEGNFEEAFELARQEGVQPFDLIVQLRALLDQAPEGFKLLVQDFVRESREELFSSREECVAWARLHFHDLVTGDLGGNLLSKYSLLGRFHLTHEVLSFLQMGISVALESCMTPETQTLLQTVIDYLGCVLLHSPFSESLNTSPQWVTSYDVETWREESYLENLGSYRFSKPQTFSTHVTSELKVKLENRIATFGEHPASMGKFSRTLFARDLRRRLGRPCVSKTVEGHQSQRCLA